MRSIYADNAATTRMSSAAIAAMLPFLEEEYGNPSSLHTPGQRAAEALLAARQRVARALHCRPEEITFTSGGSEADNHAIRSAALAGAKKGKRNLISSAFEHHAVLHTLKALEKEGFSVTLLPVHADGLVRPDDLAAALGPDTALVTIMAANNEIGTLQPVKELGRLCRRAGVPFHTDAVQAAGHIPLDVGEQNIDLLSLSAHKFHGPKGVGALYARRGVPLFPLIHGGAQEGNRRAGTENVAGIAALAAALEEAEAEREIQALRLTALRDKLIAGLLQIPHTRLNGHPTRRLPGNVNVCFEGIEGESLLLLLDQAGVCASSGSACTSGSLDPSHVLLAIGLPHDIAHGSLRLSLSRYHTEEDVDAILAATTDAVGRLRAISPVWHDLQEGRRDYVIQ